ncbi:MAG: holo-ACP synthase [Firmicutes bacterium]|nr:holo-ACP synthase [Bacillota bacterium]MCL2256440.1 holo-ACP synthase [Bacillota bacterium]
MIGIDIIDIKRVEEKAKKETFLKGIFTENEINYYQKKGNNPATLAGMFCAKEAVAKAFGMGFSKFRPIDIEILHHESGEPYVSLSENLKAILKKNPNLNISISHTDTIATAIAITTP